MEYLFPIIIFFFGAAFGSFVNVVADRYHTGLAWWKGKSFCFSCNARLPWNDLFPLVSFLFLKARCRHCGSKIPVSAFVIEVIMGILSLLAAGQAGLFENFQFIIFNFQSIFNYLILVSMFGVLLLIAVYDLRHLIIPDSFLLILLGLAFLHNSLFIIHYSTISFLVSGLILSLPFGALFLISKGRWFGLGDVKFIAVMGFLLGLSGGLSAVVLAFWLGAGFALAVFVLAKITPHFKLPFMQKSFTMKSEIPFGPFLSLGVVLALYFEPDLFHLNELLGIL